MVTIDQDDLIIYGGVIGIAALAHLLVEYLQKEKAVIGAATVSTPIYKECGD